MDSKKQQYAEEYNALIDKASELLSERVGIFNQLGYLKTTEGALAEKREYQLGLKALCEERIGNVQRRIDAYKSGDGAEIEGERESFASLLRYKEKLECNLKSIEELIASIDRAPEEIALQRNAYNLRMDEIMAELSSVVSELSSRAYVLEKGLEFRVYKGRGLLATDTEFIKELSGSLKKFKVTDKLLSQTSGEFEE